MKKCSKCKQNKQLTDFPKRKSSKDGYNYCCKQCNNTWYLNNKDKHRKRQDKYDLINKEYLSQKAKQNRIKNRINKSIYDKDYREKHKQNIAEYKKIWEKNKSNDIKFKLKRNLRRRIHHVLKGNSKSTNTIKLLGCSIEYFIKHIESQFLPGMSWDNYGMNGWHIDHIKECFRFDLTDPNQQKECFHYTNQRPLWAKDNLTRIRNLDKVSTD